MKTILFFLVVLSCSAFVLCDQLQDLEVLLRSIHWDDFEEVCNLVGVKVDPENMKIMKTVWSSMANIAKSRLDIYFNDKN